MKKLQTTLLVLAFVIGAGTLFAQRSTFFDGTYKMEGGRQTMRIESLGGSSYKAYFTGDCTGQTLKGRAEDNDVLMFPLAGGGRGDYIMIVRRGNKLDVNVKGEDIMRRSCGGTSIEGLYVRKGYSKNYNSYNNSYYGGYDHGNYYNDSYGKTYIIRSLESGLVLDANMHKSNAVSVWKQHGGANQKWIISHHRDAVIIRNLSNGKVLTAKSSSRNGEFVSMEPKSNRDNQLWYLEKSGREYYIVSKVNGNVIDVNKTNHNLTTWSRNGSAHQKWILEKTY